jgi:hypothetical protein
MFSTAGADPPPQRSPPALNSTTGRPEGTPELVAENGSYAESELARDNPVYHVVSMRADSDALL